MQIKFEPLFKITPNIANALMRIASVKESVLNLPLTATVLSSLRETARLDTTHYSTMIEGNRLEVDQIDEVLKHNGHFPGRERDESEVKGYYEALAQVEKWGSASMPITLKLIQTIHALVMSNGNPKSRTSDFRDGQNVIRDARDGKIVYLPPEAKDVPTLMTQMVDWINENGALPCPIVAGIAHYQFATIHPYYDGNGRTARLLTTLILYLGGYDLKGLYSLEEYYARNLGAYYEAISIGVSHNYYMGRAEADITKWVEYFVEGMAVSFEKVFKRMSEASAMGSSDQSYKLRKLDPKQRKALSLFQEYETITAKQISDLFGFKARTGARLCQEWVKNGFLEIVDFSNKNRKYKLASKYQDLT